MSCSDKHNRHDNDRIADDFCRAVRRCNRRDRDRDRDCDRDRDRDRHHHHHDNDRCCCRRRNRCCFFGFGGRCGCGF